MKQESWMTYEIILTSVSISQLTVAAEDSSEHVLKMKGEGES